MPPGPEVATQTPSLPVHLAQAQAMKAADSSCRTWMKRTLSWRWRNASMMPLTPSPGMPNTTSTPQSIKVSTRTSPAVLAMGLLLSLRPRTQNPGACASFRPPSPGEDGTRL